LKRCREKNLKLNPRKTKLCTKEVEYIGHVLTENGVKISEDKIKAVLEMPEPSSIENVQTLLGMVTYTCKFLPHLSAVTEPLRALIKESNTPGFVFHFDEVHQEAVKRLKKMMSSAPVLRYYSQKEPITVSCDASQYGIGSVLLQGNRPVAYASKAMTSTEYAYAQIEKELLAIVFSFKKFHTYLYGRNDITVETDHLPLLRILEKPLHQVPLRLQKMRLSLQHYTFKIVGKSGKDIPVADALSRAYLPDTYQSMLNERNELQICLAEATTLFAFSEKRLKQLVEETRKDIVLQKLSRIQKWPQNRWQVDPDLKPYFDFRDEITIIDGIVFKNERVVIPKGMQKEMLQIIHESHLGMVRCKQLARDIMYWSGMNKQIEDTVSRCAVCQSRRNQQQKEPLMPTEAPKGPWNIISADLLNCIGSNFLVVVDHYSEFIEVDKLQPDTTSKRVIESFKRIFAVHGIPDVLRTDNGPQFRSGEFAKFAEEWKFTHVTSSPEHHQSNGMAERAVQTIEHIILKCNEDGKDLYLALLNLRNTPRHPETGSPVQRLFGRRTRTRLPTANTLLKPSIKEPDIVRNRLDTFRNSAKRLYDRGSKPMKDVQPGETVRVWTRDQRWTPAKVISRSAQPRSYEVLMPSGNVWRRNRIHIRSTHENDIFQREPEEFPDDAPEVNTTDTRNQEPGSALRAEVPISPSRNVPPMLNPNTPPLRNVPPMFNPNTPPISVPNEPPNVQPNVPMSNPTQPRTTRSGRQVVRPHYLKHYVSY
jgi:transposase InsO family protein